MARDSTVRSMMAREEAIEASLNFDKEVLVAIHKHQIDFVKQGFAKTAFQGLPSSVEEAGRTSAHVSTLRPILISNLKLGQRHHDCVLHGTLCVWPNRMKGIHTILEDGTGLAIPLDIYNAVRGGASESAIKSLFPKGMNVAVKEPYFKRFLDGSVGLRVDNPADVVAMDADLVAQGRKNALARVEALRMEGNVCFADKQWDKAISLYSRCIDEVKSCLQSFRGEDAGAKAEANEQAKIVYSNRSEAWLRVQQHGNALRDAAKALAIDPTHVKSVLRKGKALCGLECYREAIACLQALLKTTVSSSDIYKEVDDVLQAAEISDKQSRLGIYDLDAYYRNGCKGAVPKCVDFVGPVKIKRISERMGRGMFVTRDVNAGELLLVANALAVARPHSEDSNITLEATAAAASAHRAYRGVMEDLITNTVKACMTCPRRLQQLYTLSDRRSAPKCAAPPMSLFMPPTHSSDITADYEMRGNEIDVVRIGGILRVNSFQASDSDDTGPVHPQRYRQTDSENSGDLFAQTYRILTPAGLWILPSFMNNSCVPNASWMLFGDVMFVRTFCNLEAGEEITIPYWNILLPLQERNKSSFRCHCPRCHFEELLVRRFPALSRISEEAGQLSVRGKAAGPQLVAAKKIVEEVEEILGRLPAADASRKNWIRASYRVPYLCYYNYLLQEGEESGHWRSVEDSLDCFIDTIPLMSPRIEAIAILLKITMFPSLPKRFIRRCNRFALMICQYMFDPLTESARRALMDKVVSDHKKNEFGRW